MKKFKTADDKEACTMSVILARVLDPTHLELSQPLEAAAGDVVQISLTSSSDDEMAPWRDAAKQHLLDAYADEDAVYDEL
jgi:hypothetical protein